MQEFGILLLIQNTWKLIESSTVTLEIQVEERMVKYIYGSILAPYDASNSTSLDDDEGLSTFSLLFKCFVSKCSESSSAVFALNVALISLSNVHRRSDSGGVRTCDCLQMLPSLHPQLESLHESLSAHREHRNY